MADEPQIPLFAWLSTHHYTSRQRLAIDLTVVIVLGALTGMVISHQQPRVHGDLWTVLGWASGVISSLMFLMRRRFPWCALVVITACAVPAVALRGPGPAFFYMIVALYVVVSRSSLRVGLGAALAVGALDLPASILGGGTQAESVITVAIGSVALIALAWLAGRNTRQTRLEVVRRREQARIEALAAEAERDERTRRKIADERVLIARELHDIVAHTMSVIAVRAGVGRMVLDSQPEEAEEALRIIETTARSSLSEIRLMVQILRSEGPTKDDLGPLPGLDDIERLVAQVEAAGVEVTLEIEGHPRALSPLADLSAYRIVQEALTNVVRHAGQTKALVRIAYLPEQLEIEIRDLGPLNGAISELRQPLTANRRAAAAATAVVSPAPAPAATAPAPAGHGIVGMRERAAIFGASLEAGPVDDGGYRIYTRLNIDAAPHLNALAEVIDE
jgi:signal transduction histidine kinase